MNDSGELIGISVAVIVTVICVALVAMTDRLRIAEDRFPRRDDGSVNLGLYRKSASQYWSMYEDFLDYQRNHPDVVLRGEMSATAGGAKALAKGTHAVHGLVARGVVAIPYAIDLLLSGDQGQCETGAVILRRIDRPRETEEALVAALAAAVPAARKRVHGMHGVEQLLGALESVAGFDAASILVLIAQDPTLNLDIRFQSVALLGKLAEQPFMSSNDPVAEAVAWFKKSGLREAASQKYA